MGHCTSIRSTMLCWGKITITPGFWLLAAGTLLAGALEVAPLMVLAALLHELGHLAALYLVRAPVEGIYFTAFGAEIRADTRYLSYGRDILCTLAGPVVNIAAALILARCAGDYLLAGANLLQGMFNLLPLTGLDGARALQLLLSWKFGPVVGDHVSYLVELCCTAAVTLLSLYLVACYHTGGFLLFAVAGVFVSIWREIRGK